MFKELELLIKAKANVIEVVSYEDKRVQGFVNQASKDLKMTWYVWNEVSGLFRFDSKTKNFEKEEDISDYLAVRIGNESAISDSVKGYTLFDVDADIRDEIIKRANLVCGTTI